MTLPKSAVDVAALNHASRQGLPPVQMRPEVRLAYERYASDHNGDLSNIPELCEFMANVGFRMCVESMTVFTDLPGQLARVERHVQRIRDLVDGLST